MVPYCILGNRASVNICNYSLESISIVFLYRMINSRANLAISVSETSRTWLMEHLSALSWGILSVRDRAILSIDIEYIIYYPPVSAFLPFRSLQAREGGGYGRAGRRIVHPPTILCFKEGEQKNHPSRRLRDWGDGRVRLGLHEGG